MNRIGKILEINKPIMDEHIAVAYEKIQEQYIANCEVFDADVEKIE